MPARAFESLFVSITKLYYYSNSSIIVIVVYHLSNKNNEILSGQIHLKLHHGHWDYNINYPLSGIQ